MKRVSVISVKRLEILILLALISSSFFLESQVTLNNPINFGDEGFHSQIARWIAKKLEYPTIWKFEGNKLTGFTIYHRPPLWNFLQAAFLFFFRNDIAIRILPPLISFLAGLSTFLLVSRLFNREVGIISGIILVTIPSFVTYSVLLYTDVLFTFFSSLFLLTFLIFKKENNQKFLFLSAIFGAFSFLTKAPGIGVYLFFLLVLIFEILKNFKLKGTIKAYFSALLLSFLILTPFLIRNMYFYKTPTCYIPSFLSYIFPENKCKQGGFEGKYKFSGRVEKVGTEQNVYSMGIVNYLIFAYGNLWLIPIFFILGLILIYIERNEILFWKEIILFLLVFVYIFYISTRRAEDTARYTLGALPLISLISAYSLGKIGNSLQKLNEYFPLGIILIVFILSFFNFKEKLDIMNLVKKFSPTFFEACDWVKNNLPEDSRLMTIWAHRAVYNCERPATGQIADVSLSRNLTYVLDILRRSGITHIFIQKFSIDPSNRHLKERYDLDFVLFLENNSDKFVKIFENGPSLNECQSYWIRGYSCDGNIIYEINYY